MIDFSTLQGLTIPEGVVTEIVDASGRVLWMVQNNEPIVLEVEKITSNTYAGGTTYNGEQFILLDIYPKTNSTVTVTYGGFTKTITDTSGAASPNAQQVCFGTFNGVVHDTTPSSGTLIIEGGYSRFGVGSFSSSSKNTSYCGCVRSITSFGSLRTIGASAFRNCTGLNSISLENFTSIGANAFADTLTTDITLTNIESVGDKAFYTGADSVVATINGLPKSLPRFAIGANDDDFTNTYIYINDSSFSWDTWVNTVSRPCNETIRHEYTGGSHNEYIYVYFNGTPPQDITSVELRDCTRIADYAFYDFGITNITIPDSVTAIGKYAFDLCNDLTVSSLPSGLKTIGECAFYGLGERLTISSLPSGLTSVGAMAFHSCSGLNLSYLPSGLKTIGDHAFYNCNIPEILTIPASVTSIGDGALNTSAGNLHYITVLATTPPSGGSNMFGSGVISITVPVGCGDAYKAASYWSEYADKIVEVS